MNYSDFPLLKLPPPPVRGDAGLCLHWLERAFLEAQWTERVLTPSLPAYLRHKLLGLQVLLRDTHARHRHCRGVHAVTWQKSHFCFLKLRYVRRCLFQHFHPDVALPESA
nr:E4 protein [Lemur mastadenovirus]WGN96614.1 E4 protein [Lemur mastadenovirus]